MRPLMMLLVAIVFIGVGVTSLQRLLQIFFGHIQMRLSWYMHSTLFS